MERMFGRYRLMERIGRGGMGEVFRARMEGPGGFAREVAVKLILPSFSGEARFRELFNREARLAASLHHPNIVPVLDYGRESEQDFLVMEFVRGTDLRSLLLVSPAGTPALTVPESAFILHRVARALAHAHSSPEVILHRDVSPHNILLSREGEVKLADFGIARVAAGEATGAGPRGKAAFMSPEQAEGAELTPASDLFSLGSTAYLLLSGTSAFAREGEAATLRAVAEARHAPLDDVGPDLPAPLAAAVEALLQKDPARRPRSAQAAADLFEPFLDPRAEKALAGRVQARGEMPAPAAMPPAPTAPTLVSPRRRTARWMGAGAVAVLAVAAVLLILPPARESRPPMDPPQGTVLPSAAPAPAPPRPEPLPPQAADPATGMVALSAAPWAFVSFQGRDLGTTPLVGLRLPVGRQTLVFSNPALGARREVTVEVREGLNPPVSVEMGE